MFFKKLNYFILTIYKPNFTLDKIQLKMIMFPEKLTVLFSSQLMFKYHIKNQFVVLLFWFAT